MHAAEKNPVRVVYERRNRDLDSQRVWCVNDENEDAWVILDRQYLTAF